LGQVAFIKICPLSTAFRIGEGFLSAAAGEIDSYHLQSVGGGEVILSQPFFFDEVENFFESG
jgi:hypothetical protein